MLTIASLNIHNMADRWLERRELIVAELLRQQPDVLALQEVRLSAGQAWWLCNQLNARLGQVVYTVAQQRRWRLGLGRRDGVALLSKRPIVAQDAFALGYGGRVALRINIELPSGHLVDVVTTFLHEPATQPEARLEQVMQLVGWLNERGRSAHQIITGGMNDSPTSEAITYLKQHYVSAYAVAHGRDPIATWPTALLPTPHPSACLDYIFTTPTLHPQQVNFWCTKPHPNHPTLYPSDHVGLFTTLQLRDTTR